MADFSDILFLSDFDRTLSDGTIIPPRNLEAIERFKAQGGMFSVATGRSIPTFRPKLEQVKVNAPVVLSNGSIVYDFADGKTWIQHYLTADERAKIDRIRERHNSKAIFEVEIGLEIYLPDAQLAVEENEYTRRHYEWVGFASRKCPIDEIPDNWMKAVFTAHPDDIPALVEEARAEGLNAVRSLPFMVEVQTAGVDKGVAAKWLANKLGRKLICAGDAANDLELLAAADRAFIPSSAYDEVRGFGYEVVADCADGAIADIIERLERERA